MGNYKNTPKLWDTYANANMQQGGVIRKSLNIGF